MPANMLDFFTWMLEITHVNSAPCVHTAKTSTPLSYLPSPEPDSKGAKLGSAHQSVPPKTIPPPTHKEDKHFLLVETQKQCARWKPGMPSAFRDLDLGV